MTRIEKITLTALAMASLFAGCDAPEEKPNASASASDAADSATTSSALKKSPTARGGARLVTLGGGISETVAALGHQDRIVGVDASSIYPDAMNALPRVGYYRKLDAEGVLSLDPEHIIASAQIGPPSVVEQLGAADIKLTLIEEPEDIEGSRARIEKLGEVLGEGAKAAELLAALDTSLERVKARRARADFGEACALFVYVRGPSIAMVSGKKTSADEMLRLAGISNCMTSHEGFKPLTPEAVIASKATYLIVPRKGADSIGGVDGVLGLKGVRETPAGQAKRVVLVDDLALLGFGPRVGEALLALQDDLGVPGADGAGE